MKHLITIITVVSVLLNIALVYLFVFKGETVASKDNRTELILSEGNYDFVLAEMRVFLESIQQINEGLLTNNPEIIIKAANLSGGSVIAHAPNGMLKSLPIGFKKLGFSTHDNFDQIALIATNNYNRKEIQTQLNSLLNKCITCHRSYKINTPKHQ